MHRSSHQSCMKKVFLRNFAKFTGKHLCQSLFFKVADLRPATLLKKRLWHSCFPVNFAKFLRTSFLQDTPERQLLSLIVFGVISRSLFLNQNLVLRMHSISFTNLLLFLVIEFDL